MKAKRRSVWVVEWKPNGGRWRPLVAKTQKKLAIHCVKSWLEEGEKYRVVRYDASKP